MRWFLDQGELSVEAAIAVWKHCRKDCLGLKYNLTFWKHLYSLPKIGSVSQFRGNQRFSRSLWRNSGRLGMLWSQLSSTGPYWTVSYRERCRMSGEFQASGRLEPAWVHHSRQWINELHLRSSSESYRLDVGTVHRAWKKRNSLTVSFLWCFASSQTG